MKKLALSLGIIIFGIIAGQIVKSVSKKQNEQQIVKTSGILDKIRLTAFLLFNPIVMVNAYWIIDFSTISMLILPFICLILLFSGGMIALLTSKIRKHTDEQRAAMFGCGSFSNLGTIGGLLVLVFLGEEAYTIAALYFVFENFYNYLFAYPMIKSLGEGKSGGKRNLLGIFKDPTIIIYISAIIIGLSLNVAGVKRPDFMATYNNLMVPIVSFMLTFAISYKMEFRKIKSNMAEGFVCIGIKYLFCPLLALSIAYAFGLQHIANGLVIKTLIIMSMTPCGFNSILTPTIYKADKDVANSVWIMNMVALMIVILLEYIFIVM